MTVAQAVSFAAMRSANLAVEVRHLPKKPDVLEQRRTVRPAVAMFWLSSTVVAEFCGELLIHMCSLWCFRLLSWSRNGASPLFGCARNYLVEFGMAR
jgi:hypothetical protein